MSTSLRIITFVVTLFAASHSVEAAQEGRFASSRLEQLAQAVRIEVPTTGVDACSLVGTYRGYPVVARISGGEVVHLGIDLFGAAYKVASNELLCDFAERYLLELLTVESDQARARRMYDDGVVIIGDLQQIPLMSSSPLRFDITFATGRGYRLEWYDDKELRFSISVPAQCEQIYGMNKIELEDSFRRAVQNHSGMLFAEHPRLEREPVRLNEELYALRRGYYLLEQMQYTLYYTRSGEDFVPVCDTLHPLESLQNLLSLPSLDRDYTLDVTQQKYGFRSEAFFCPLKRMIDFCLSQGCVPYMGVESSDKGVVTAVLIMANTEFGYNHLFKIVFDTQLLGRKEGAVAATLNAYVPTHNLGTLYDEQGQTRHLGAPKIKL